MPQERKDVLAALAFTKARIGGKAASVGDIKLGFSVTPISNASWSTASVTGALTYIPYKDVQRFATYYHLTDEYDQLEEDTLNDYLELQAYFRTINNPSEMAADDAKGAAGVLKSTFAHLAALEDFSSVLLKANADMLDEPQH